MSDRIPVRMLKHARGLNPGEIAGFVPQVVEELIAAGAAEPYEVAAAADDAGAVVAPPATVPPVSKATDAKATDAKADRKAAAAAALPEGGAPAAAGAQD